MPGKDRSRPKRSPADVAGVVTAVAAFSLILVVMFFSVIALDKVYRDLTTHAKASAVRNCAAVRMLEYLANTAQSVVHRTPAELAHIHELEEAACHFVPLP